MISFDVNKDVRELLAIGDPFLFRIGLGGACARYGLDRVRKAMVEQAARDGAVSIASAPKWCQLRPRDRKARA